MIVDCHAHLVPPSLTGASISLTALLPYCAPRHSLNASNVVGWNSSSTATWRADSPCA
jgi:hypothetical protein